MGINGSKEAHHESFQFNSSNSSPEANETLYNKLIMAVFSETSLGESDPKTGFNESIHNLLTDNSSASPEGEPLTSRRWQNKTGMARRMKINNPIYP